MRAGGGRSKVLGAVLASVALSAALALPGPAEALTGGPVIRINSATADRVLEPVIAADPAGGFVAAWTALEGGASDTGIYVRRFDADGEPLTGAVRVNTTTAESQSQPAIAADPGGGFIVAWTSFGQDGSGAGIYARRLDAGATPLSTEIAINATQASHQTEATIAADPGGGFTVVWASHTEETKWDLYARRFDALGAPLTGEIAVNTTTDGDQERAGLAPDGSGGFTVAWQSRESEDPPRVVYARRFDSSGAPLGGEISVDAVAPGSEQVLPGVAGLGSAGFVVTWGTSGVASLRARLFDATGAPSGDVLRVDPDFSSSGQSVVAADPGGGFTVVWQGMELEGLPSELFARRFDAAGSPLTVAVRVDSVGGEDGPSHERPVVAPDGDGGFTVAWERFDEGDWDAFARHFASVPETAFESAPVGPTKDSTPTFDFSSDEYGSAFECRLDGAGFAACSSPLTPAALPDGPHSFEVRATNPDGMTDATPAASAFTVDTVVPGTSLDSGLPGPSSDTTPTFSFSSGDPGAGFECKLDSGGFVLCESPLTVGPLPDGAHSFLVRARDGAGNVDASPEGGSFTIDTHPPDLSIEYVPDGPGPGSGDPTPTFVLATNEQGTSFECQVDDGPASACASPFTTEPLADGSHVLSVWATDQAGNTRLGTRSFTVDTTAPDTSIASGPSGATNDTTPSFGFTSTEPGGGFECSLDGADFIACASPLTVPVLGEGPHSFEVRATDEASNTDASPATRSFTVDTTAPDTSIASGPSGATSDASPSFGFSSSEPGGFECSLDGAAFSACGSPSALGPLRDGPHTFDVRAVDSASNADPTPAARSFVVDTAPPLLRVGRRKAPGAGRQVVIRVSCAEPCSVRAGGAIVAGKDLKVRLSGVSAQLGAGESVTLRLRSRPGGPLRRLLANGTGAAARLRLEATDAVGNSKTTRVAVGVRLGARAKRG